MQVTERASGDRERLAGLICKEANAKQRDRLRAVELALEGLYKLDIAVRLKRSKSFVENWVYAYRQGGIQALKPGKSSGRHTKLAKEREQEFLARVDAGPTPQDRVSTLRGADL